MVVEAWLARAAAARGGHVALDTPSGSWSYCELLAAAQAGAAELRARGAEPGSRVAIVLPPGLAFAQALHACLLLGAAAVPLDVRAPAPERERLAGDALIVDEPLSKSPSRPLSRGTSSAPGGGAAGHDLDAVALVIHTSGTTASPRAVELTYGNVLWSALGSAVALGSPPHERWLSAMPLSHVGGLSILLRSAIASTTAVVHERFETERVLRALLCERITLVSLVATTLERLLDAGLAHPPSLRCALTGGGPVPARLLERAREAGVPVSLTYGLTEACSQVTTVPQPAIGDPHAGAGPPLFCTRVRIDSDGAGAAGTGVGEILVRGATVAPRAPAPDGWLYTGDLGTLDEQGRLEVKGRSSETIISGGQNVSPWEVEAVLEAHPDVREAAVLGAPDPKWGEAVRAIVVRRADAAVDGLALQAHCARALAPYKVPKKFVFSREPLPRTASGKLLRRELRGR
jgi:o-succinylbenzoate---CoA ligase